MDDFKRKQIKILTLKEVPTKLSQFNNIWLRFSWEIEVTFLRWWFIIKFDIIGRLAISKHVYPGKGTQSTWEQQKPVNYHVGVKKKITCVIHNPKDNLQVTCHSTISAAGHNLNFLSVKVLFWLSFKVGRENWAGRLCKWCVGKSHLK